MLYITYKVVTTGRLADVITMASVVDSCTIVSHFFCEFLAPPNSVACGWQWGENVVLVYMKEDYNSNQNSMDSGCLGSGGDGGPYVVMEHMPKPQQKLRRILHFNVWVVVGSVFFPFLFPLLKIYLE